MWHNELSPDDKDLQSQIREKGKLPHHIGIIMDGNGRWAERQGLSRYEGHRQGIESVRDIVKSCSQLGIEFLTLYSFSIENWNRPFQEVKGLMQLLELYLRKEVAELHENKVRIKTIGKTSSLPTVIQDLLYNSIDLTKKNKGLTLTLALSYSGRWDIVRALQMIALDVRSGKLSPEDISEDLFASYLQTRDLPDVDLLIRTSGELRLSNFLLWEMAYGEIFITDKLWPDFRREDLYEAINNYSHRERRFGKTSNQIASEKINLSQFWNK